MTTWDKIGLYVVHEIKWVWHLATNSVNSVSDIEASYKNLTEERAELRKSMKDLGKYDDEINYKPFVNNCCSWDFNVLSGFHFSRQEWLYFKGSFYHISTVKKNWQDSRNACLSVGADLMIINSKEKQVQHILNEVEDVFKSVLFLLYSLQFASLFLNKNFTRQFKKQMWIGLTDEETEDTWRWVDGTPLDKRFAHF